MMIKILKIIAPKSFVDGLNKCNYLGKKLLKKNNVKNILDIGCGDGNLTMEFVKIINSQKIYGIEYVDESRVEAEKKELFV